MERSSEDWEGEATEVELTGEAVWPGVFYLWKVLDYEFNFFYMGSFGFSISCINFGNLCFPGTWHLL